MNKRLVRINYHPLFTFILGSFIVLNGWAHSFQPYFKHYGVEEGLPSSEVYQVKQDSKGYLWFVTDRGVCRYNGHAFQTYGISDGLTDDVVFGMQMDHHDRLWFYTFSGRLFYFDQERFHPHPANDSLASIFNNLAFVIKNVYFDSNDTAWISNEFNHLALKVSPDGNIAHAFPLRPQAYDSISFRAIEDQGFIFTLNWSHKPLADPKMQREFSFVYNHFSAFEFMSSSTSKTSPLSLSNYNESVASFASATTAPGTFVFSTGNHLLAASKDTIRHLAYSKKDIINSFLLDSEKKLWVGIKNGGVLLFHQGLDGGIPDTLLTTQSVSSVYEDHENGIWFTTLKNGVFYLPSFATSVLSYSGSDYSSGDVSQVHGWRDTVFFARYNGENYIFRTQEESGSYPAPSTVERNYRSTFYIITPRNKEELWIMETGPNLSYWDANQSRFLSANGPQVIPIPNMCNADDHADQQSHISWYSITSLKDQVILKTFDSNKNRIDSVHIPNISLSVKTIMAGCNDFWFANKEALSKIELAGAGYEKNKIKVMDGNVIEVQKLNDSTLAIGTVQEGLVLLNVNDLTKQSFSVSEGMPSNRCNGIFVENETSIWVATNSGASQVVVDSSGSKIINYTLGTGYPTNEIRDIYVHGDVFYTATNLGLIAQRFRGTAQSAPAPKIYISEVLINRKNKRLKTEYKLNYTQTDVQIHFVGLTFRSSGKNQFRYRLLPNDTTWKEINDPNINFASLSPGEYQFEVGAVNVYGSWSKTPAIVRFTITPPIWQTWWFITVVIVGSMLALFFFFRWRLQSAIKQGILMRQLDQSRFQALTAQMNPHFIFNSLNSIQLMIANDEKMVAIRNMSRFSKLIRQILQNSQKNFISLKEELSTLELYLEMEKVRLKEHLNYSIKTDPSIEPSNIRVPSTIFQPIAENAIWHGIMNKPEKEGLVEIKIERQDDFLKCTITDDGVGRKKREEIKKTEQFAKGTGTAMEMVRKRLQQMSNKKTRELLIITDLVAPDGEARGTQVTLFIPLENKAF